MAIFGNPAQRVNFNNVLDQILKYAQESTLQEDRQKGQMDYLGEQQRGYLDLADFNAKNTAGENRIKAQETLNLEGAKYDFKKKEIKDQMISNLSVMAPIKQLSGVAFYNRENNISDPTTVIALHQTVQDQSLALAKAMKGTDLSPQEIGDVLSSGPEFTKDILEMKTKVSQFGAELPIKQQTANTATAQVRVGERNAATGEANMRLAQEKEVGGGKDYSVQQKQDLTNLTQIDAYHLSAGINSLPKGQTALNPKGINSISGPKADVYHSQIMAHIAELKAKVSQRIPLSQADYKYMSNSMNISQINLEGPPDPTTGLFPSQVNPAATGGGGAVVPAPLGTTPAPPAAETRMINGVPYMRGLGPNGEPGWIKVKR